MRRRAPEGSYYQDGDWAAGVFGVLATMFALMLGFVVFLSFTRYDAARAGARGEALAVSQMFETARLLPADSSDELSSRPLRERSLVEMHEARQALGMSDPIPCDEAGSLVGVPRP